ncbi:FxsA family protein [Gymnodinialimonas ceratoperidinii]|uniref:FxsA family protein n=1 Tax=Gymnodinialimonas ceratoperidinii TaxID=2856823 RepID=A0A8F6TWK8_9RHOB|nr:FxsA family protein [Gymnodinialimonas ceratoperidinii]QXT39995.1 FxsA family protein [Gymnodinialimonas ceratoperidinii]
MWLFILFIAVPLIEIGLFIQVGGWLGLWPTLLVVLLTAIAGTALVKSQGAQALAQLQNSFSDLRDPTEPLAHGAMILFSGALLLTPGFFTDFVGFALLVPAVRQFVLQKIKERVTVRTVRTDRGWEPQNEEIIEGTYTADEAETRSGPSGWRRD